jgi:hypothetical protein
MAVGGSPGAGGTGGGGSGGNSTAAVAGTANTGGGGGGWVTAGTSPLQAANGGSGLIIVRYLMSAV